MPHQHSDLERLVRQLAANSHELEWVEFKHNNANPQEIGEYISALSNAAALHNESRAFLVWGIEDETHDIVGTTFKLSRTKNGNEPLETWLAQMLSPRVDFVFREGTASGEPVVVLEIPAALHMPTRFKGQEYIRVGSSKRSLRDYPEKERNLWHRFTRVSFEDGIATSDLLETEMLSLLDFADYFELSGQPVPTTSEGVIDRLMDEGYVIRGVDGKYQVTNLGAITFGRPLKRLGMERKGVRVVVYEDATRNRAIRSQDGGRGYVSGFNGLMAYINAQLPESELIGQALRTKVPVYPEVAVRELVANALIHQDFSLGGTGPMVEIFAGRIEISNPGRPLLDPLRLLDAPPRSRNEKLAGAMRRFNICEERGSGIDRVVSLAEAFQLPAPEFIVTQEHTIAILYAPRPLADMTREDRIRATYQHACLQWVAKTQLTNSSLRKRFGISDGNSAVASRIIGETVNASLIKLHDPENTSRRHARYVPYWA
jgi:ATP-dependent DNA helicase RecG